MEARREIGVFFPEKPVDVVFAAQPGELALGILPGAELHLRYGLRHRRVASVDGEKLLVADGLEGGGGFGEAGLKKGLYLPEEAALHHGVHPAVDARIEVGPVPEGEADGAGPVFRGPEAGAGIVGGEGLAGLPVDL